MELVTVVSVLSENRAQDISKLFHNVYLCGLKYA